MDHRPLRLDILTRVSRTMGREGDSYGSPEVQLRDCRNWIGLNHHFEGHHFHEENVSGGALLSNRPGLTAVIERMRRGDSDGVVVRAYDRFMRSVQLSWEVIELIEGKDGRRGIGRLFAAQGNVDFRTPTGRLLFTQLQSLAQYQREHARYEWAVARTRAWERGVWLARPPMGYVKATAELKTLPVKHGYATDALGRRFDAEELDAAVVGGLVRDPIRGPIVEELFERRAQETSLSDLARWVTQIDGRPWGPAVLGKLLTNTVYLGHSTVHRCGRDESTGRVIAREVLMSRQDDHVALVEPSTFRAAQRARGLVVEPSPRRSPWLLSGMIRCAGCRYLMKPDTNGRGFRTYICSGHHGMGQCPSRAYVGAHLIESYVIGAVLAMDEVTITEVEVDDPVSELETELEQYREEVRRLAAHLRRTSYPELIAAELDDAEGQLRRVENELAKHESRRTHRELRCRTLAELLADGTFAEKRAAIAAYLDRVVLRRGPGALRDRVLLLMRGEEAAFEPLPGRGRRVELQSWPVWNHDDVPLVGKAA